MTTFESQTIDGVMTMLLRQIQLYGTDVTTRGRTSKELTGVALKIFNPLGRIYHKKGQSIDLIRIIGHMLWNFREATDLESIAYYDTQAHRFANEKNKINTGYGYRMMPKIRKIIALLRKDPGSRRAIAQVLHADLLDDYLTPREFPCLMSLQFFVRMGKLDCIAFMRSQNVAKLLPQDMFLTTMIQEYVAAMLDVELGTYIHMIGSAHVFEGDECDLSCHKPFIMDKMWNVLPEIFPHIMLNLLTSQEFIIRRGFDIDHPIIIDMLENFSTSTVAQIMILLMTKSAIVNKTNMYDGYMKNLLPFYQQFHAKETT